MTTIAKKGKILIGNTFPLGLIERKVEITLHSIEELKELIKSKHEIYSFWGHNETVELASYLLSADIKPKSNRPPLSLDEHNFPTLDGESFTECWILTPRYIKGYRPNIGELPDDKKIADWKVMKINFGL